MSSACMYCGGEDHSSGECPDQEVRTLPAKIPMTADGWALWLSLTDLERSLYRHCIGDERMARP